jgi:hypothetical protein
VPQGIEASRKVLLRARGASQGTGPRHHISDGHRRHRPAELADAQPVTIGEEEKRPIAVSVRPILLATVS